MVNLGIIGAGRMAKVHINNVIKNIPEAKIKAIADPYLNSETKEWLKDKGIIELHHDYKKILDDPDINAVMIFSSTDTHAQISMDAITAGKHTFCEKPIDRSYEKVLPIIELLKENKNIKYQVGFNRRFDHNFRALKNVVDSGKLGDLHFLRICSRDSVTPPESYVKTSGGIFLDMMIHDFDLLRYLSKSEVEEVYAVGKVLIYQYFAEAGDVDTAVVTLNLKNGATAVIDNSRKAVYGYDQRAEIHGSKGYAEVGNDFKNSVKIFTADGVSADGPIWDTLERYIPAYTDEVRSFIDAIECDKEPEVNVNDGLQAILIALACKKSLTEKRPVKLSEICSLI